MDGKTVIARATTVARKMAILEYAFVCAIL
jgi:hypothetical protein